MLALLRWLSRRSMGVLHATGALLGWAGYVLSASYRQRLRSNAALAGISAQDRRAAVAEAGRMVAELPRLWLRPATRPLEPPAQWQHAELIERALADGRGLVLLTPHLGAFEVIAQAYAERFGARQPVTVLYRPARQAWLRELETTARNRPEPCSPQPTSRLPRLRSPRDSRASGNSTTRFVRCTSRARVNFARLPAAAEEWWRPPRVMTSSQRARRSHSACPPVRHSTARDS